MVAIDSCGLPCELDASCPTPPPATITIPTPSPSPMPETSAPGPTGSAAAATESVPTNPTGEKKNEEDVGAQTGPSDDAGDAKEEDGSGKGGETEGADSNAIITVPCLMLLGTMLMHPFIC